MMKKFLGGLAVATSLFAAMPASATLTNWYLDTDGAGGNAAVQVADFVDLTGRAYVHNTFTSASTFNFNEAGTFNVFSADTNTGLSPFLTATFAGTGSGTVGGNLTFDAGGLLRVFSGATEIATFSVVSGSAVLNANSTLPNGTVSIIFEATNILSGYFFDEFGADLSGVNGVTLGFATTNAIPQTGPGGAPAQVPNDLIALYNANYNPDVTGPITSNSTTDLYISNNGQYRLDVNVVPEPSMLGLVGLAFLGLAMTTRRRKV